MAVMMTVSNKKCNGNLFLKSGLKRCREIPFGRFYFSTLFCISTQRSLATVWLLFFSFYENMQNCLQHFDVLNHLLQLSLFGGQIVSHSYMCENFALLTNFIVPGKTVTFYEARSVLTSFTRKMVKSKQIAVCANNCRQSDMSDRVSIAICCITVRIVILQNKDTQIQNKICAFLERQQQQQ